MYRYILKDYFAAKACRVRKEILRLMGQPKQKKYQGAHRSDGSVVERSPSEREVLGSIPDRVTPKTLYNGTRCFLACLALSILKKVWLLSLLKPS